MHKSICKFFHLLLFLCFCAEAGEPLKGKSLYVWSFAAKEGISEQFAVNVTEEVEELLINSRQITVLQRREMKGLFEQSQQEILLDGINSLADSVVEKLRFKKVNIVVLGEVKFENESGLIKIRVFVNDFNSEIYVSKTIFCPKSIISDPQERMPHIKNLVNQLLNGMMLENKNPVVPPIKNDSNSPIKPKKEQDFSLLFNLLPGGAQFQRQRPIKGLLVASSAIGFTLAAIWAGTQRNTNLENAARTTGSGREHYIDQSETWKKRQSGFVLGAVGVYLFGLTDLLRPIEPIPNASLALRITPGNEKHSRSFAVDVRLSL
ncbi:MAG: hypothetical protein ACRBF0_15160 [Calditrichia bacterium]